MKMYSVKPGPGCENKPVRWASAVKIYSVKTRKATLWKQGPRPGNRRETDLVIKPGTVVKKPDWAVKTRDGPRGKSEEPLC